MVLGRGGGLRLRLLLVGFLFSFFSPLFSKRIVLLKKRDDNFRWVVLIDTFSAGEERFGAGVLGGLYMNNSHTIALTFPNE